jgi:sulfite exporter TauE/SafE
MAAGAAVGAILGAAGSVVGAGGVAPGIRLMVVAAAAALAGGADLAAPRRVPTIHRQVDEDWLTRYRGWVYGVGFGAQIGMGVVTVVTTASVYAWMAAALVTASAAAGALVGLAFGVSRALPLAFVAGADRPERLRAVLRRLTRWATGGRLAASGACLLVAAGCLVAVRP